MNRDQSPEVGTEDTAIVPTQSIAKGEWPKRIRTLSTSELDRLAIDEDGRFYWDGRPVMSPFGDPASASPSMPGAANRPVDRDAFDILERAALELAQSGPAGKTEVAGGTDGHGTSEPAPVAAGPSPQTADAAPATAPTPSTIPTVATAAAAGGTAAALTPRAEAVPVIMSPTRDRRGEKVRLSLSFWQSLALMLATIAFLVGAAGIAAHGLVAAHQWGCQIGAVSAYCPPPPPAPEPPVRHDIPA